MSLVKFFSKGNVEIKEVKNIENFDNKIIRILPEKHEYFNVEGKEYVDLNKDNVKYLSEGDMIILHDFDGSTYWHELKYNDALQCLCYKSDYSIEDAIISGRYKKISVRNDFYIPEYAKSENN